MGLLDAFAEPEPEDQPSLMEEAARYAPAPWQPAHVEPEGATPLPSDFPVADPFCNPRVEKFKRIMAEHAVCRTKNCARTDSG